MSDRPKSWLSEHAGVMMAVVMTAGFLYGIISWADAQTTKLTDLASRVAAIEQSREGMRAALQAEDDRLSRIEQKINDLAAYLKGNPPP